MGSEAESRSVSFLPLNPPCVQLRIEKETETNVGFNWCFIPKANNFPEKILNNHYKIIEAEYQE